ncbi:MAG: vanadium-dependent haloperoxidase, partial [Chlorobi bacterium]|nr:vanadium-dependent haloperoxidase [Chlorobiota bacterium]
LAYGEMVGARIVEWSQTDNFIETRTMIYNVPPRTINPAYWEPTDSVNLNPLEPYWGTLRCFALPHQRYCDVELNITFSTSLSSQFYNEALEVKTVKENLTQQQKDIALFWANGGGTPTPSGHWLSVISQIISQNSLKLDRAAEAYVLCSIAMADAFISCWESKYRYNLLRPKTYIREYINPPDWMPFITTPPFPEYTSGHSVQSAAVSEVLTNLFGSSYSFTDTTHSFRGYSPRSFTSFYQARDEAAISRLYGGIHFRQGIENGKQQGRLVGQTVLSRVRLR